MIRVIEGLLRSGVQVSIMSTVGPTKLYREIAASVNILLIRCSLFKTSERGNIDRAISYFISTISASITIIRKVWTSDTPDVLYTSSDYLCDVLPALFFKTFSKDIKWAAIIHHKCSEPQSREGNYLFNLISYYGQALSHVLIAKYASTVLRLETEEGQRIEESMRKKGAKRVVAVRNGIDADTLIAVQTETFQYDACFVGGFRASKGVYNLLEIWADVVQKRPSSILCLMGSGMPEVVTELKRIIRLKSLELNVEIILEPSNLRVYKVMKASKLYVSASEEEGWGIALYEAISLGLKVVAYDLPAYQRIKCHLNLVTSGDKAGLARKISELLSSINYSQNTTNQSFITEYDWGTVSKSELDLIR